MSKRRERELEEQIEQLNAQVQSLNKQIDSYRAQEKAIVQALTQAQNSAAKHVEEARAGAAQTVADAEERAGSMLRDAQAQRDQLLQDAEAALQDARARATAIVEAAQAESARRLAQTEASVQDFEARLRSLNAVMRDTAADARERARQFAAAMEAFEQETPELLEESRGLSTLIGEREGKLPEEYDTPQELMHGIYQLQGRNLPPEAVEEKTEEPAAEPEQPAAADETEAPETPEPAEEPAAEKPAAEEPEERVWTVDEVIKKGAQPSVDLSEELDVDLDSLLDEIIGN
jgi:cell division septum initiation protein DivIVA